jgi:predicted small secreted protein
MAAIGRRDYLGPMNPTFNRFSVLCLVLTVTLIALATSACQTSRGFGKDVEKLGDKIQEKSK